MSIGAKQGAPTIRNLSRKRMFELLDTPLKNHVWSWGARSELSGRVYLAVWNHEIDTVKGRVLVTDGPEPIYGHGDRERHGHLRVIQQGAEAFGVILRTLTGITLPRPRRAKQRKKGCAFVKLANLYRHPYGQGFKSGSSNLQVGQYHRTNSFWQADPGTRRALVARRSRPLRRGLPLWRAVVTAPAAPPCSPVLAQ